jgi:predicted ATPase
MAIHRIEIENFKSIKKASVRLSQINILIGANGAGKSNFIQFFKLMNEIFEQRLNEYVARNGKSEAFLHFGSKVSERIFGFVEFENDKGNLTNAYEFELLPTIHQSFFVNESSCYNKSVSENAVWDKWRHKGSESVIKGSVNFRDKYLKDFLASIRVFHFHDTSQNAPVKQSSKINDNRQLRADGGNLAAYLFKIKENEPNVFRFIEKTIQSVAPFFHGFDLQPDEIDANLIDLVWKEKGSDQYFNAHHLSDGTLRFICLATLLLQPVPPLVIIIDEPELGLHPFAIEKLAGLIQKASIQSQIIISTQSTALINHFSPDEIIVAERSPETSFHRLKEAELSSWLEEYSMGEIWERNIVGGRP